MADYAGAVAAMRARYVDGLTAAPSSFQNEDPPQTPWPPQGTPWCYFEVVETLRRKRGVGTPGNQTWLITGNIFVHVFVPKGYGFAAHLALAGQAGDLFKDATFYNAEPGACVRCWDENGEGPTVQGGDSASDDGNWFGLVVVIPFQFFFIG
ncbi:hypothetical protein HU230_0014085 [Bradyrhizobium quebecense]|uniref:Uncharacterized protein n=1 Tax=Bradyrhizobium quebecense TaxID=2748629 RepID=A0A974AAP0_9BRAD|nr:hypothetical protein [Bradyrhizobium quebecense]UGA47101.1 hypothetical protein HU230_0014085 [Bradyrhizobium quebecense]